jgi:NTP pyrophosphatase (non-canonical NTP hydrolase)
MQKQAHDTAVENGWWDQARNELELIALIMSELGEAVEAVREGSMSHKIPGHTGLAEELADVVIRVMDMAEQYGIDLSVAIISKNHYNKSRPYRHGGKKF